jgi:hypothetical protein
MSTTPALRCCVSRPPSLAGSCRYQELSSRQAISTPPPLYILKLIGRTFRVVKVGEKSENMKGTVDTFIVLTICGLGSYTEKRPRRVKRGPPPEA